MLEVQVSPTIGNAIQASRRADIDWLRFFAVILLVPFHAALIYDLGASAIVYVPKQVPNIALTTFVSFTFRWHMPLLFVLAGMSAWFALQHRTPKTFVKERCKRLGVPLIFGILVLMPVTIYLFLWANTGIFLPFDSFYVGFFTRNPGDFSGITGAFSPGPLWFILFLLVFSLVGLPLMLYLRKRLEASVSTAGNPPRNKSPLMILVTPAVIVTLGAALPGIGDKNPFTYFVFYFCGYILASNVAYQRVVDRIAAWAFFLGVGTIILDNFLFSSNPVPWTIEWVLEGLTFNGGRWFWVVGFLGLGHRFLNREHQWLPYARQASYPFYISHMLVLTIVGITVVQVSFDPFLQFTLICILAILGTFGVYDLFIRRNRPGRFLFGMKSN